MKTYVTTTAFIFSLSAQAATHLQFLPGNQNAMAIITTTSDDGVTDEDPQALMAVMNVPIQNSPLGPGKSIVTQNRDFNLICGEARKQCQVILHKSPNVVIDAEQKKMSFVVTGDDAKILRQQFFPEGEEVMEFMTSDQKFVIEGNETKFVFSAGE